MHYLIAVLSVLVLAAPPAEAASLYDGEGLYVQAGIDIDADLGIDMDPTSTDSTIEVGATTTTDVGSTGSVRAAASVATDADLAAYTESLETEDQNVDRAEAEVDGDVTLSYYHPARLFGIFPVRAKSTTVVSVSESGMLEAKTTMPWWSFLATGTGRVAEKIDADLANSGQILTDMKLSGSAAAKARVLEAVASAHARAAVAAGGL